MYTVDILNKSRGVFVKLSYIVPVYKVEKYLEECIESILSQTMDDYEIILVDDGSPDSCPQMCDAYAEKYPEKIGKFSQYPRKMCSKRSFPKKRIEKYKKNQKNYCNFERDMLKYRK